MGLCSSTEALRVCYLQQYLSRVSNQCQIRHNVHTRAPSKSKTRFLYYMFFTAGSTLVSSVVSLILMWPPICFIHPHHPSVAVLLLFHFLFLSSPALSLLPLPGLYTDFHHRQEPSHTHTRTRTHTVIFLSLWGTDMIHSHNILESFSLTLNIPTIPPNPNQKIITINLKSGFNLQSFIFKSWDQPKWPQVAKMPSLCSRMSIMVLYMQQVQGHTRTQTYTHILMLNRSSVRSAN